MSRANPEFIVNGYYPSSDSLLVIDGREYKKGEGNKEFQVTIDRKTGWGAFMRILKGTDQEVIDTITHKTYREYVIKA